MELPISLLPGDYANSLSQVCHVAVVTLSDQMIWDILLQLIDPRPTIVTSDNDGAGAMNYERNGGVLPLLWQGHPTRQFVGKWDDLRRGFSALGA